MEYALYRIICQWLFRRSLFPELRGVPRTYQTPEGGAGITDELDNFELERGTGIVFPDAEHEQLRAVLAAEIGKSLAGDSLTVRDAERHTGFAAADFFSRIRRAKLRGFTIDRLTTILDRLNRYVHVSVSVMPRKPAAKVSRLLHVST